MTREEQTIQAAKDFLPNITKAQLTLFAAGVMWADEHPKEDIKKLKEDIAYLEKTIEELKMRL